MTSVVELCRWMNVADSCERCWSTCATVNTRVLEGTCWTALRCSESQCLRVLHGPEVVLWTFSSEAVLLVEVVLCLVWHDPAGLVQLEWSFCFLGCSFSLLLGIMWRRPLLRLLKNWLPWVVGHIHTCGGNRNGCRADAAPIAVNAGSQWWSTSIQYKGDNGSKGVAGVSWHPFLQFCNTCSKY